MPPSLRQVRNLSGESAMLPYFHYYYSTYCEEGASNPLLRLAQLRTKWTMRNEKEQREKKKKGWKGTASKSTKALFEPNSSLSWHKCTWKCLKCLVRVFLQILLSRKYTLIVSYLNPGQWCVLEGPVSEIVGLHIHHSQEKVSKNLWYRQMRCFRHNIHKFTWVPCSWAWRPWSPSPPPPPPPSSCPSSAACTAESGRTRPTPRSAANSGLKKVQKVQCNE